MSDNQIFQAAFSDFSESAPPTEQQRTELRDLMEWIMNNSDNAQKLLGYQ